MVEVRRAPGGRCGRAWFLSAVSGIALATYVTASVPADAQEVVVGSGQTSGQIPLDDGETLIVEPGGTVRDDAGGPAVVEDALGATFTIINRGTIVSTDEDAINASDSTLDLTNSGLISGGDDGIHAENLTSLVNSGTISGDALGIDIADSVTSFINSGTISGGSGRGIFVGGAPASLVNSGMISGGGDGIHVEGGDSTNIVNSGTISGGGHGISFAYGSVTSLVNSGTISGGGKDGISVNTGSVTSLVNSGTISGGDRGVFVRGEVSSLVNSGTVRGASYGIFAYAPVGSFVNSGRISGGSEDGFAVNGSVTSLVNSGKIRGGTEETDDAGIDIDFGSIVNTGSGLIEGLTGVQIDRSSAGDASVTNAGRIRSRSGPSGAAIDYQGAGTDSLTVLGRSTIEGVINWDGLGDTFATGPGRSSALTFTDNTSDAGDPPTEFAIDTGGLPFAVERTAAGAAGTATTKVVVIDPSSFGVSDTILADITGGISGVLTNQGDAARDVNGAGVAVASANGTSMTIAPAGGVGPVLRAWAEVFGGWRGEESDGSQLGSDHVFGGAVAGIETDTAMDGMRAGIFIGGSGSKVDVEFGSQDTEIGSVFGGVYAAHQAGDVAIDAALTVGLSNYDQRRFMNDNTVAGGVDTARADYYGFFVSPEVTVSSSLAVTEEIAVRPSLTLRYAGLFLDGYTEKGSNANLTVENRDVHVISARGQVAVPVHMNTDAYGTLTTEIRVGADGRATVSEDNVRATLLGQNLNFTAGGDDEVLTGFAGAAFAYAMTTGTRLYGNIEAGYGTDEAAHVTGRAGVKMPF